MSQVAKDLGKGEVFKHVNKLLSKFAHPTALSIVWNGEQAEDRLKQKFYDLGMRISEGTLQMLSTRE